MGKRGKHLTKQDSQKLSLLERTWVAHSFQFPCRMSRCISAYLINCLMSKERAEGIMAREKNTENVIEEVQDKFTINLRLKSESHI